MKLEELAGFHRLQGVEMSSIPNQLYNHCDFIDCVIFTLDGITYRAVKNEDDGYRSYCKELEVVDTTPAYKVPDLAVYCNHLTALDNDKADLLSFIDVCTNKEVLLIGTKRVGDYYPICIFEYHPENMIVNQTAKDCKPLSVDLPDGTVDTDVLVKELAQLYELRNSLTSRLTDVESQSQLQQSYIDNHEEIWRRNAEIDKAIVSKEIAADIIEMISQTVTIVVLSDNFSKETVTYCFVKLKDAIRRKYKI